MLNTNKHTWTLLKGGGFPEFNKTVMILVEQDVIEDAGGYCPSINYAFLQDRSWFGEKYRWVLIDEDSVCGDCIQQDETVVAWRYVK